MTALRQFSAMYLVAASAFTVAIVLSHNPQMAKTAKDVTIYAGARGADAAVALNEYVLTPAYRGIRTGIAASAVAISDLLNPPPRMAAQKPKPARPVPRVIAKHMPVKPARAPVVVAKTLPPPQLRPAVKETPPAVAQTAPPKLQLVPQAPAPGTEAPTPGNAPPSAAELARVSQRLRDSLTREMVENFSLFLYVSKADKGPLAQRMYVYQKQDSGDLVLLYNWPVSTGREKIEFNESGAKLPSFTPQGYYELDPDRLYTHYRSMQWDQPMPYAMFFNWVHEGDQTGLAIHGASGEDIGLLGTRASAGCIRLAPENAQLLFTLIRDNYKGLMPKFAYDKKTATMSNDGVLMHSTDGRIELTAGYKVLVFVENYGGENVVAALF